MTTDKNEKQQSADQRDTANEEQKDQQPLTFHNPLNPDDPRVITQEDLENEEKYKEALTERD